MAYANWPVEFNSSLVLPSKNWERKVCLDGSTTTIALCYFYINAKLQEIVGKIAVGHSFRESEYIKVNDYMYDLLHLWSLANDSHYQVCSDHIADFWTS